MVMFLIGPDPGHHVASDTLGSEFRKRVLQRFPQKANYSSRLRFTMDMKVKEEQTDRRTHSTSSQGQTDPREILSRCSV